MPTIFRQKVMSNGISFNDPFANPLGVQAWGIDVMDGWKDTGDVEEFSTDLGSYRDGVSSADYFPVRKRYITISGYCAAESVAAAEAYHDLLVRDAFPRNKTLTFQRYEFVPKQVLCKRSAKIEVDWTAVPNGFRWMTTLLADDPMKYSISSVTGSGGISNIIQTGHSFPVTFPMTFNGTGGAGYTSIGINNIGTAPSAKLTATITGPLAKGAWRLINDTTGDSLSFDVALTSSDTLVVDFLSRTATLNGFQVSAAYTGTFWKLQPGLNTIRLYAEPNAQASVTIVGYSAWE